MSPLTTITTTQLRTKSPSLVQTLLAGYSVELTHRSQPVGVISPIIGKPAKPFNAKRFLKLAKELNLPKTTYAERDKIYRKRLMEKYGHNLS